MTSRHPAVSCACPKCQSERRTTPTPAADANPFVGTNWQVRADTPATDTPGTYGTMTPTIEVVPPHYPLATEEREAVARAIKGVLFRIWGALYGDAASRLADAALSALAPYRAAEILAAEARGAERERASKGTVTTYKRGFGPGDGDSAIEHGAGK